MRSFYQDRLGTNIGKALKKDDCFLRSVVVRAPDGARFVYTKGAYEKIKRLCRAGSLPGDYDDVADAHASKVSEKTLLSPPHFSYYNRSRYHTRTGSGGTNIGGALNKGDAFPRRGTTCSRSPSVGSAMTRMSGRFRVRTPRR
jgi:hypothetical protein